ncbi:MAG: type II secretion system minor pseudopilin GspK [Lautropia sp.]
MEPPPLRLRRGSRDRVPSASGRVRRAQRGAAIVTAILVVTLASIVVAALFYRESVSIRSIENRQALSQTRWVERAVIDWGKVILRSDLEAAWDHASDIWATPVVDAQFDESMTGGAKVGDNLRSAFIAGAITDAQSRFNINALVLQDSVLPSQPHVEMLTRLMESLGLPASLVPQLVVRIQQSRPRIVEGRFLPAPLMKLSQFGDLRDVPGFDDATMQKLQPHVTVLPDDARLVNLNTASAELIAASTDGLSVSTAKQFVALRERRPARSFEEAGTMMGNNFAGSGPNQQVLSLNTSYFVVDGVIRYDRVESRTQSLLRRQGTGPNGQVQVIWQHRN